MNIAVVGGAGHVGLPFCAVLASVGHQVVAIDSDVYRIQLARSGKSSFSEPGLDEILSAVIQLGYLTFESSLSAVRNSEVVVVVVGTDLTEQGLPQNDSVLRVVEELCDHLREGSTVVLRSTIMPGTTARVAAMLRHLQVEVAFCPERIAEGMAVEELRMIPQLIGSESSNAPTRLRELFDSLGIEVLDLSWSEAELSKLILNTWRYSQFAIANEFAIACEQYGVDFSSVRVSLLYKYPRGQGLMAPGFAGGPCLRKDTLQLINGTTSSAELFREVIASHDRMIPRVVNEVLQVLGSGKKTVVQLGISFKPGSDDLRGSVGLDLARALSTHVPKLIVVDPHVSNSELSLTMMGLDDALKVADLIVVGTRHPEFRGLIVDVPVIDIAGQSFVTRG